MAVEDDDFMVEEKREILDMLEESSREADTGLGVTWEELRAELQARR